MRTEENVRRRLRQLIRDELVRLGIKSLIREAIHELAQNDFQPRQTRRPDLKVIK